MNGTIINCFCCWSDFLGFSDNFEKGRWTFSSEPSQKNIERLLGIWSFLHATHSPQAEVSIFLNDGVARTFDITEETKNPKSVVLWFVLACQHHLDCSRNDVVNGFPGLRGVMSYGERVQLGEETQHLSDYLYGSPEAHARFGARVCVYSPKETQLNLAFARAYIIENAGACAGLKGPGFFVDGAALNSLELLLNNKCSLEGIVSPNAIEPVTRLYKVERLADDKAFRFCVLQKTRNDFEQIVEFTFAVPEIQFSRRGIITGIHRLTNIHFNPELMDGSKNVILPNLH